ncbi:hypothetical protein RRF57_002697 [Xylaria bambusicola]|uniref:Uncharacterized protein n=1 Tax=Xylaria bambusicola TaxID=326684 RepID=A0AAN7UE04_9PEZI
MDAETPYHAQPPVNKRRGAVRPRRPMGRIHVRAEEPGPHPRRLADGLQVLRYTLLQEDHGRSVLGQRCDVRLELG